MKITVKSEDVELTYEAQDPTNHPLSKFTGKEKFVSYDIPFIRLIELIETMSDKAVEIIKAKDK